MSIALRLRGAFVALTLLLGAVVAVQLTAMRRSAANARALGTLAERQRLASAVQPAMLEEMRRNARKFVVTRDTGYVRALIAGANAFDSTMAAFDRPAMTAGEIRAVNVLHARWRAFEKPRHTLQASPGLRDAVGAALGIDTVVGASLVASEGVTTAIQEAAQHAAAANDAFGRSAARLSLAIAFGALLFAACLSWVLVRSIVRPLERLGVAARAVASGDLMHRVPDGSGDEIARLGRDFNTMTGRLAEVDRMKRDFISNVSHDLKTPLSSMQETTDVLLDELAGPLSPRQRQLLSYHRDSGLRLSSMLAKLLELSRLEGRTERPHELLDFTGLVRRAVDHVRAARDARPGIPAVELATGDWVALRADAEGIAQVLDNLLENALKFSPSDGVVRVSLREEHGTAVLVVADEGPGVPDDDKDRIFERFYQTSVGRSVASRGVGLGLAICRHVVQAHGGRIVVKDNAPCGAAFEVRLPGALLVPPAPASRETAGAIA
ncbi:MAG TPA: ATP-binding protein [Gemmatimonadaceae bacterium]|nr:ATP-binding protein [Gemmatimonadaceae bacterium]